MVCSWMLSYSELEFQQPELRKLGISSVYDIQYTLEQHAAYEIDFYFEQ